jgi:hypothetical protein
MRVLPPTLNTNFNAPETRRKLMARDTLLACAAFCLSLGGCATQGKYTAKVQTWIGHHTDELISSWGPPSSSTALSSGGKVLEYARSQTVQSGGGTFYLPMTNYQSGTVNAYGSTEYGSANYGGTTTQQMPFNVPSSISTKWCSTRFTTNRQSIIINWAIEGNDCTSF